MDGVTFLVARLVIFVFNILIDLGRRTLSAINPIMKTIFVVKKRELYSIR